MSRIKNNAPSSQITVVIQLHCVLELFSTPHTLTLTMRRRTSSLERTRLGVSGSFIRFLVFERRSSASLSSDVGPKNRHDLRGVSATWFSAVHFKPAHFSAVANFRAGSHQQADGPRHRKDQDACIPGVSFGDCFASEGGRPAVCRVAVQKGRVHVVRSPPRQHQAVVA